MSKAINKIEYMHNLFRYIEDNISADLDTELLSRISYVSRDKLYYDFYNLSGYSIKEYVRKRRLSNALALIKTSNFSLTEIAFQCGYSSHQALCRAVRQTLGLTPTEYKSGDTYYFFPPCNAKPIQSVIVSNQTIPQTLRVLFFYPKITNIENMAVNTFLQVFPDYSGRIFGRNGKQQGNRFCYELYLTDTSRNYDILTLYGFEKTLEIPCYSAIFATSTVQNNESVINAAWDYLYAEWLQNSKFEYTDEPYYEEYILKNGKLTKLKLYLPIRERSEETKITLINNPGISFITAKAKGHNAEEIASQIVIDYLTANSSYIINNSKELYLHKEKDTYVCGVRVNSELHLVEEENIMNFTTDQNNYLVLESNVMGDYVRYAELLLSFSKNNGMETIGVDDRKGIFAVYDANESFNNLKIKMYCPIKIRTK